METRPPKHKLISWVTGDSIQGSAKMLTVQTSPLSKTESKTGRHYVNPWLVLSTKSSTLPAQEAGNLASRNRTLLSTPEQATNSSLPQGPDPAVFWGHNPNPNLTAEVGKRRQTRARVQSLPQKPTLLAGKGRARDRSDLQCPVRKGPERCDRKDSHRRGTPQRGTGMPQELSASDSEHTHQPGGAARTEGPLVRLRSTDQGSCELALLQCLVSGLAVWRARSTHGTNSQGTDA